jgi:hypothetical protein
MGCVDVVGVEVSVGEVVLLGCIVGFVVVSTAGVLVDVGSVWGISRNTGVTSMLTGDPSGKLSFTDGVILQ